MTTASPDSVSPLPIPTPDADWFLQKLVDTVNQSDIEVPLTLTLGGMLVTGVLISGREYFRAVAADFTAQASGDDGATQALRETFDGYLDIYRPRSADEPLRTPPAFAHLREARFYTTTGEPIPTRDGVWWRGRLTSIDGFHFGMLTTSPDD